MATVPPPDPTPEAPPIEPAGVPDEVSMPGPDTDVPDPGDPAQPEAHPS